MKPVEIVVGVLKRNNKVLISRRQRYQDYAGFWEFPGGKVERGEVLADALIREFKEEVGCVTKNWQPLITIPWHYEHASVVLNVFVTDDFDGEPLGNEGQEIEWVALNDLENYRFPEANEAIKLALSLSDSYMISGKFSNTNDGLNKLTQALDNGIRLVQLRAKWLSEADFIDFAVPAIDLVHEYSAKVLLNGLPSLLEKLPQADGLQLPSTAIQNYLSRPIPKNKILSISTHNLTEISIALELDADIILLSPVKETTSHPGKEGIGWQEFKNLVKSVPVPVYALGGMKVGDIVEAKNNGAQGVAAISAFWD